MHGADAGGPGLREDRGGEVDFVKRRADARAELHDDVRGLAAEFALHFLDRDRGDAEFGAFAPGVQQRDDAALGIDEEDGTAVGDVNAEADARVGGDEPVGTRDGCGALRIDDGDFTAVDLIGGDEDAIRESGAGAGGDVKFSEPGEGGFAFHFHIEAGNASDEAVADGGNFVERRKGFGLIHAQSEVPLT